LAFAPNPRIATTTGRTSATSAPSVLRAAEEGSSSTSVVNQVTGEELEMMMQEWEQPLVVDAYATVSTLSHSDHVGATWFAILSAAMTGKGKSMTLTLVVDLHFELSIPIFRCFTHLTHSFPTHLSFQFIHTYFYLYSIYYYAVVRPLFAHGSWIRSGRQGIGG
jgi:hypothetical protein